MPNHGRKFLLVKGLKGGRRHFVFILRYSCDDTLNRTLYRKYMRIIYIQRTPNTWWVATYNTKIRARNSWCIVLYHRAKIRGQGKFTLTKKGGIAFLISHFIATPSKKLGKIVRQSPSALKKLGKIIRKNSLTLKKIFKQFLLILSVVSLFITDLQRFFDILLLIIIFPWSFLELIVEIAAIILKVIVLIVEIIAVIVAPVTEPISIIVWFHIKIAWFVIKAIIEFTWFIIKAIIEFTWFISNTIIGWIINIINILPLELRVVIKILILGLICIIIAYCLNFRPIVNILSRLGFGDDIIASRRLIENGFIYVNSKQVTNPYYRCFTGDIIEIDARIVFPLHFKNKIPEPRSYYYIQILNYIKCNTISLENMVLQLGLTGLADTISASRRLIENGFIYVNSKQVTNPYYRCFPGATIKIDRFAFIEQIPEPRPIVNILSRLGFGDDTIIASRRFENEFFYETLIDSRNRSQLIKIVAFQEALMPSLLPPFSYLYKPVFNCITSCTIPRSALPSWVSFFYEQIFNLMTCYTNSLANIVFRSGFADDIIASRRVVEDFFVYVNKERTSSTEFRCFPGDIIEIDARIVFPLLFRNKIPEPSSYYYIQILNYIDCNTISLENMVFQLGLTGLADTISASRQLVENGFIYVNSKQVTNPYYRCFPDDTIKIDRFAFVERIPEPRLDYNKILAVLFGIILIKNPFLWLLRKLGKS